MHTGTPGISDWYLRARQSSCMLTDMSASTRAPSESLLTVKQVGERLQLDPERVRELIRCKQLGAVNVGLGRRVIYRVEPAAVEAYIASKRTRPLALTGAAS